MLRRPQLTALAAVVLSAPLWVLAAGGLLQVRACVPAMGPVTSGLAGIGGHLTLLRPAPDCPSGTALDDGALAVVGTVGILTLLSWLATLGALAGLGAVLARARGAALAVLDVVVPGRRAPRLLPAARSRRGGTTPIARVGNWRLRLLVASASRRAPPA